MVDDRDDRDSENYVRPNQPERGRRGGYAAAFDERVAPIERADVGAASIHGVWTGMVAGIVMALIMMIIYAVVGPGFWFPMKIIAVSILGPAALMGGAVPVIIGFIVHLVTAAVLGAVFAFLVAGLIGRVTTGTAVTAGILYGLIVWISTQFIILPVTFPVVASAFVPWIYALSHAVYGATLGLLPNPALKA